MRAVSFFIAWQVLLYLMFSFFAWDFAWAFGLGALDAGTRILGFFFWFGLSAPGIAMAAEIAGDG